MRKIKRRRVDEHVCKNTTTEVLLFIFSVIQMSVEKIPY